MINTSKYITLKSSNNYKPTMEIAEEQFTGKPSKMYNDSNVESIQSNNYDYVMVLKEHISQVENKLNETKNLSLKLETQLTKLNILLNNQIHLDELDIEISSNNTPSSKHEIKEIMWNESYDIERQTALKLINDQGGELIGEYYSDI